MSVRNFSSLSPIAVWKCLCKIDARNDSTEAIVYVNCGTTIHLHGFDLIFCFVSTFCNAIRYNGINIEMNSPRLENISWKSDIGGIARLTQLKNAALYAVAHILFNRFFCFITNYCVWKTIHLVVVAVFFWHTWIVAEFQQITMPWTLNTIRHTSNTPKYALEQEIHIDLLFFLLWRWYFSNVFAAIVWNHWSIYAHSVNVNVAFEKRKQNCRDSFKSK